jgi:hypothetical protein
VIHQSYILFGNRILFSELVQAGHDLAHSSLDVRVPALAWVSSLEPELEEQTRGRC